MADAKQNALSHAALDHLDGGNGISNEDCAERESALLDRLLEAERLDCLLIEASDGAVEPRPDCDARA